MLNSKRNLRHQFFFLLIHISCLLQKCILLSTTLFPQSCVFSSVSFRRFLCPCVFIQVLCLCLCLSFCLLPRLLFLWVTGLEDYLQQKYVYIFPSVSRFKLLAVLHKQPHLDIRRIYGFRWSGESKISQSLALSFLMPKLTTGGDRLSCSHAYYKRKSTFLFSTTRLKAHNIFNSIYAHNVFSITRLSNNHSADIWHSLFVLAQHFDSRPSHKRDDHASAAYGGRHSYQADTVRFKICS